MAGLNLYLLGSPHVEFEGEPFEIRRRKAMALLLYLAVQGERQPRDALAALLWPENSQQSAHKAFRRDLSELNLALKRDWLDTDRTSVGLRAGFWLDVTQFQRYLAQESADPESLMAAANLYRDDFLTGFTLPDCPAFDEWQLFQGESLRHAFASALERLVEILNSQANYEQAITYARRWLALDPLHEPVYCQLMRLYAQIGQPAAALRQYERCYQILADELGVSPAAETTTLYEQIRDRKVSLTKPQSVSPPFLSTVPFQSNMPPPFVARERELNQLDKHLGAALNSRGHVIFITGEAGQGKTSLLNAFAAQAQTTHPELTIIRGVCSVYTGFGDPYAPFREAIRMLTGDVEWQWAAGMMTRDQALNLWRLVPQAVQALVEHGPDLIDTFIPGASLLSRAAAFAPSGADWLTQLESLQQRKSELGGGLDQNRLFDAYTSVLETLAEQRPILFLLDDLHWADLASVSLLFYLGRRITGRRILVVGAYRPEDLAQSWDGGPHPLLDALNEFKRLFGEVWVDLAQADQAAERHFVDALLDTQPNRLSESFRQALARHTGGHPLFTVELLRDMQERDNLLQDAQGRWIEGPNLIWDTLPPRVEGVIGKRMERLDAELREVLTVASVEGEAFTAEMIAQVVELNERLLVGRLSGELDRQHRLVKEQGLVQLNARRLSRYLFRHNLFQKYLYHSLGEAERAYLHEAVGNALEAVYGDAKQEIAVQLARHFQAAGVAEKAIDYLLLAGQYAIRLSANTEAITHLHQGLALLKTLPASPQRSQQELTLLLTLGVPVSATKGYGAPEVEKVYARARDLGQQLGNTSQLFPALYGLWRFYLLQGQLRKARELGGQILQLAQTTQDSALLLEAHRGLGATLFHLGELVSAQRHLDASMALYDVEQHGSHAFLYGHDPAITCFNYAAHNLWLLGYPDQSLARSREIFELVQNRLSHPFSLAYTLAHSAWLYKFRQEVQLVRERSEAAIALTTDEGFPQWLAMGTILSGWALAVQGQGAAGIDQIRQGLDAWRSMGNKIYAPQSQAMLVEAYVHGGQIEAALATLAEAQALAQRTGESWWNAELYRLQGELILQAKSRTDSQNDDAEGYFRQAIEIARQQRARSLELRAVMSLCRLCQRQGKTNEARQILAEIYNWFTEGFDTIDLKEARALLQRLSEPAR